MNIIKFPGVRSTAVGPPEGDKPGRVDDDPKPLPSDGRPAIQLTEDQQKAVTMVASGMTFIIIGIKPTNSGADFFTALHGDEDDLRNAEDHIPGIVSKLFSRKGIRE